MRMLPSRPILPRGKAEDPEAILRTAADIVELPGAWRQGALAEDDLGVECSATEVRTARVCTHGALHRATKEGYEEQTARARRRVERLLARRGADADGFMGKKHKVVKSSRLWFFLCCHQLMVFRRAAHRIRLADGPALTIPPTR